MEPVVIIDFERTGLSPDQGARPTEIACVLVRDGQVVDRYQSLMNAGVYVSPFIEELTGISNEMVRGAPPVAKVMGEALRFLGNRPLIAHNASFDRKFWEAEVNRIGAQRIDAFACSMRVARRVFPEAPNHKLASLCEYTGLAFSGQHHRALADAEATANLVLFIEDQLRSRYRASEVTHQLLRRVQETPVVHFNAGIQRFARPVPRGFQQGVRESPSDMRVPNPSTVHVRAPRRDEEPLVSPRLGNPPRRRWCEVLTDMVQGGKPTPSASTGKVIVSCPSCRGRLRLPGGRSGRVTCAHCGSPFQAKT